MKLKSSWLTLGAYAFLILPFIIFCLGFLKPIYGIPFTLITLYIYFRLASHINSPEWIHIKPWDLGGSLLLILTWVFLSGVGGFAFQNYDHQARNAIFRDLINFSWPVYYSGTPGSTHLQEQGNIFTLVYYIGFWLPAALAGKAFGWIAAQIALFIWTSIGIFLVTALLQWKLKTSLVYIVLLVVFFSGMDVIGVRYKFLPGIQEIYLTPPVKHLETWAVRYQYSSMTTQLFWVFNQAVPTWICLALHVAAPDRKRALLLWVLCFFFAPIPAVGFLPLLLLEIPVQSFNPENLSCNKSRRTLQQGWKNFLLDLKPLFTVENLLGGGTILAISVIYFLTNQVSTSIQFIQVSRWNDLIYLFLFLFLEWFFLWMMFFTPIKKNASWYVVGISLLLIPLFHIGTSDDFCMRASVPALFMLMVWLGKWMAKKEWRLRPVLILVFLIGAVTPVYEINRSIYRTIDYLRNSEEYAKQPRPTPQQALATPWQLEKDHPYTLVADDYQSLSNFTPQQMPNYLGDFDASPLKIFFKDPVK